MYETQSVYDAAGVGPLEWTATNKVRLQFNPAYSLIDITFTASEDITVSRVVVSATDGTVGMGYGQSTWSETFYLQDQYSNSTSKDTKAVINQNVRYVQGMK